MLRPVTIAPKILAAPNRRIWLNMSGWVPTNSFFSLGAAFLSLAPNNAIGYYVTGPQHGNSLSIQHMHVSARTTTV